MSRKPKNLAHLRFEELQKRLVPSMFSHFVDHVSQGVSNLAHEVIHNPVQAVKVVAAPALSLATPALVSVAKEAPAALQRLHDALPPAVRSVVDVPLAGQYLKDVATHIVESKAKGLLDSALDRLGLHGRDVRRAEDALFSAGQAAQGLTTGLYPVPALGPKLVRKLLGEGALEDLYADSPKLTLVNPGNYAGDPVYFVNGIFNSFGEAKSAAALISNQLHRPVFLLYNDSANSALAVYDRAGALRGGPEANPVTRQITGLLLDAAKHGRNLSLITHSDGSLTAHNALLALERVFGLEGWVRSHLAWVTAGTPFNVEAELGPRPARFTNLVIGSDWAGRFVGGNGEPTGNIGNALSDHHIEKYIPLLRTDMIWDSPPASGATAVGPKGSPQAGGNIVPKHEAAVDAVFSHAAQPAVAHPASAGTGSTSPGTLRAAPPSPKAGAARKVFSQNFDNKGDSWQGGRDSFLPVPSSAATAVVGKAGNNAVRFNLAKGTYDTALKRTTPSDDSARYPHDGIDASKFGIKDEVYLKYTLRLDPGVTIDPGVSLKFSWFNGIRVKANNQFNQFLRMSTDSKGEVTVALINNHPPGVKVGEDWIGDWDLKRKGQIANFSDAKGAAALLKGKSPWDYLRGRDVTVEEHMKLNTPGKNDGVYELKIDGVTLLSFHNGRFRDRAEDTFGETLPFGMYGGAHAASKSFGVQIDNVELWTGVPAGVKF
jgi:hypothetical protein